ncbi:uncharacterized protein M6B38_269570 [Iris pallida]|uniref:DUF659 domain-containing protein n=1 Tax=Iris pallida TaxID=29817 RepID=A0AAX6G4R4_IRIPA|nr:uncharacterized protein M6B38_154085 [Iris pallida]KAJ6823318.1 uncharacterized protein M6B38_383890 [Iris pallida]KAJ6849474.1 uncharacterized protein M6B38_269570 [Iris pallida]
MSNVGKSVAKDSIELMPPMQLGIRGGVRNVVQIITHDASCYMEAAGAKLEEKYNIFWTVCADYCINKITERLESMDHVKMVLDEAKAITRFLYSDELLLELMRKHIVERELIRSSMLKSVVPFITLENMVSERENLVRMFTSEAWSTFPWICDLVMDSSFGAAEIDIL